ncbi:MAG: hypothetical protein V1743_02930 [Nanoarchaeota archaeon]
MKAISMMTVLVLFIGLLGYASGFELADITNENVASAQEKFLGVFQEHSELSDTLLFLDDIYSQLIPGRLVADLEYINTCFDFDSGTFPLTFGYVTGFKNSIPYSYADRCQSYDILREYFCIPGTNFANNTLINCTDPAHGLVGCSNGKCITADTNNSCADTDNGPKYTLQGIVFGYYHQQQYAYIDNCQNTTILREYFCIPNDTRANNTLVNCQERGFARCRYGECIPYQEPNSCYDTSPGTSIVPGVISGHLQNESYFLDDKCLDATHMRNYFCLPDGRGNNTIIDCANPVLGTNGCSNGRCVYEPESCMDSDSGINPPLPGFTEGYFQGNYFLKFDECQSSTAVKESYCIGGTQPASAIVSCTPPGWNYSRCRGDQCIYFSTGQDSCFDSDGGVQPGINGFVAFYKNGSYYSYDDICLSSTTAREYFCFANNTRANNTIVSCNDPSRGWTECYSGRCT